MTLKRLCSKTACGRPASCTLQYDYANSTVILGPLSESAEPHAYDLCSDHANRLTAPRGWEIVRPDEDFPEPEPEPDELVAVADAVRRRPEPQHPAQSGDASASGAASASKSAARDAHPAGSGVSGVSAVDLGRRHHLRLVEEQGADAPATEDQA